MKHCMKLSLALLFTGIMLLNLVSFGCTAKKTISYPEYFKDTDTSSIKTVTLSKNIKFPEYLRVGLPGYSSIDGLLAALVSKPIEENMSNYFNSKIKEKVDINAIISERLLKAFVEKIKNIDFFNYVEPDSGEKSDAEFVLTVLQYGIEHQVKQIGGTSEKTEATILISAMLIDNPPYVLSKDESPYLTREILREPEDPIKNPVLWGNTVQAKTLKNNYTEKGEYEKNPELLKEDLLKAVDNAVEFLASKLTMKPEE